MSYKNLHMACNQIKIFESLPQVCFVDLILAGLNLITVFGLTEPFLFHTSGKISEKFFITRLC